MQLPFVEYTHHHLPDLAGCQLRERHFCMFDVGLFIAVGEHKLEDKMEWWGSRLGLLASE